LNNLKQRILAHLVNMAKVEKHYAWWSAKNYAEMQNDWADLPELLTQQMKSTGAAK